MTPPSMKQNFLKNALSALILGLVLLSSECLVLFEEFINLLNFFGVTDRWRGNVCLLPNKSMCWDSKNSYILHKKKNLQKHFHLHLFEPISQK